MIVNIPPDSSIDMFVVLSQVTIKVPLSKLMRIPKHRDKAIDWVGGVDKEDVGFYSGLIESLFSATQMCVMILWGKVCDLSLAMGKGLLLT